MESVNNPPVSNKEKKKAKKVMQKIKIPEGSVDFMVQHTNDDSVVSKRSAVQHGYFADGFLRHFVRKPTRRSPLINRGYYLRMRVLTSLVGEALAHLRIVSSASSSAPAPCIQVISLGAGFDTLAFRTLLLPGNTSGGPGEATAYAPDVGHLRFYDVDFPPVMQNKAALMRAAPSGTFPADWEITPERPELTVRSRQYAAVGVDLRCAEQLLLPNLTAANPSFAAENPTIVYAECVMQYMPSEAAAKLLQLIARSFPNALFAAYDQIGPHDSFGAVMRKSLKTKNSPLLGIEAAPSGIAMTTRAVASGFAGATFASFYDLSRHHIAGAEKERVEALEPFDESEEWAEMCEHYGITLACTSPDPAQLSFLKVAPFREPSPAGDALSAAAAAAAVATATELKAVAWPTGRFGFEGWGNGGFATERLAGDDVLFVTFGGFVVLKGHARVNTLFAHSLREGDVPVISTGDVPPPMVFHTFTRLSRGVYAVFGGRASPASAHGDTYVVTVKALADSEDGAGLATAVSGSAALNATWRRLVPLADAPEAPTPPPRCRHCAVALSPTELLVVGGRTASGALLDDVWRGVLLQGEGEENSGCLTSVRWSPAALAGPSRLPAMCSAAAVMLPSSAHTMLLSGGLLDGERSSSKMWAIDTETMSCSEVAGADIGARYSHAMCVMMESGGGATTPAHHWRLLVLGGSTTDAKSGISYAVTVDVSADAVTSLSSSPARIVGGAAVDGAAAGDWRSRHSAVWLPGGRIAVLGGGYTCFSFGTYAERPYLLLPPGHTAARDGPAPEPASQRRDTAAASAIFAVPRPPVEEMSYSAEAFVRVAREAARPVVFRDVDFGACRERWADTAYLKRVEGGTTVSVHVAPQADKPLLDFARKNFSFRHVRFDELIDHLSASNGGGVDDGGETWYFRSVATHMKTERANVWKDFAGLGDDFTLPEGVAAHVMPRLHQSCLRLNAWPLQLWTHYDTADNVLCQITGCKRVVLFPPSALGSLYMKGSSSLVLDITNPDLVQYPRFLDAWKSAVEVTLHPGDMLYFPALWFHHITTLPSSADVTISVNAFFRHFDEVDCDPKDLYGNKNPPAVVALKDAVVHHAAAQLEAAHMSGTGTPMPATYREFALRLAIQELEEMADCLRAGGDDTSQ